MSRPVSRFKSDQSKGSSSLVGGEFPPLKALMAFSAASRHGSFARGAEELGISPSAVSHHINRLETFLNVKLFLREAGRTTLTSAGIIYAREVDQAFAIITEATGLVAPRSRQAQLTIASSPSFAAKWLQRQLPEFLTLYPDARVRLSTLSYRDDLEADSFDVAIAYSRAPRTRKVIEPLLTERVRPLCSPRLVETLELERPEDLSRATLIHSVNAMTWSEYFGKVGVERFRPVNEVWLDQSDMAIEAAVRGVGVILDSEFLAQVELRDARLVAPFGDEFSIESSAYYLVKARRQKRGSYVHAFERWLKSSIDRSPSRNG